MGTNYIQNTNERRKARNERKKKPLCRKSYVLVSKCGGEVFFQYIDENQKTFVYATDKIYEKFKARGAVGVGEVRLDESGVPMELGHPTPTKDGPGDCNFVVVTRPNLSTTATATSSSEFDVNTGIEVIPIEVDWNQYLTQLDQLTA